MTQRKPPLEKNVISTTSPKKKQKKRKPRFRRHESWRYKRLRQSWRRPRGLDNKMRLAVKGWPKSVKIGYGGSRATRGLHPSGYKEILVHTPDQVTQVKPDDHAIRIARTVGTRKRIQIASLAREREIHVLNPLIPRELTEEIVEEDIERLSPDQEKAKQETERPTNHVGGKKELKTDES